MPRPTFFQATPLGDVASLAERAATGRAVVTWEGPGEPIVLALYGPDGEAVAGQLAHLIASLTTPVTALGYGL